MIPQLLVQQRVEILAALMCGLALLSCPDNPHPQEPPPDTNSDTNPDSGDEGDNGWAGVLYVDASAPSGGDGSAEAPFRMLTDAMAMAPGGATIEIAVGSYQETVTIDRSVTIAGAGVLTRLDGVGGAPALIVTTDGLVRLLDLKIDSVVSEPGDLFLGGVRLTGEDLPALEATNGSVVIEGGAVEGGVYGGIDVVGGQLDIRQVELSMQGGAAVVAVGTSPVSIVESVVRGEGGPAIRLERCDARLSTLQIEDVVELTEELGDDGTAAPNGSVPDGILVLGGRVEIERISLVRVEGSGVVLRGATAEILESDFAGIGDAAVAILATDAGIASRATVVDSSFEEGFGVGLRGDGSHLEATGNVFRRWQDLAIDIGGGSTIVIEDNTFVEIGGDGVRITGGGAGSLSRNRVVTAGGIGIAVADQDEALTIEDNSLRACLNAGLLVDGSTNVTVSANAVWGTRSDEGQDDRSAGIILARGSGVTVVGNDSTANEGHGILVVDGVRAEVTGNRLADNGGYGLRVRCPDEGVEESEVTSSGNEFLGNGLGEDLDCR